MLKHLFKLMWNKKRSHTLLIVEILISFLVLFGTITLITHNLNNYREPTGFDYKNIWVVTLDRWSEPDSVVVDILQQIKARVETYPEVESASYLSVNTPYSNNFIGAMLSYENRVSSYVDKYNTDTDLAQTLNIPVLEGRWFNRTDDADNVVQPIVINEALRSKLFGNESALGKRLSWGDLDSEGEQKEYCRIIGIIGNFKSMGEYQDNQPCVFTMSRGKDRAYTNRLLLRVKPYSNARFEAQLVKELNTRTKGWSIEVTRMEDQRQNILKPVLIPIIIFSIVSGFLLINVALGIFGVLNISITQRSSEIGMRRALGATQLDISKQFIVEIWVIASFSILIGLLFAVQYPLMNVFGLNEDVYWFALVMSVLIIYSLVITCALYPSLKAARIQPATALHEE